ncbi:hypothetical protein [Halostreptopolyspora alba]|uniref:hypothetical protein n=1 Tax=Halostreptopolyspora alba TaxID=2487137 RepID=UPI0011CDA76A
MATPIRFEPLAQETILRLPPEDREALIERLYDVAEAEDPMTVADPYLPGGVGPLPYHGVVIAGRVLAVISLYVGEIRVLSIKPHT